MCIKCLTYQNRISICQNIISKDLYKSVAVQDVKHLAGTNVNADSEKKTKPENRVQHKRTSGLFKRLLKAEGEIQELKIEIANQRASWEMRFVELQKRQHNLRDQVCGSNNISEMKLINPL